MAKKTKRNNISLHQRIKCAMEWQKWLESKSKNKKDTRKKRY